MLLALIRRLGLDRIGDVIADEARRLQARVLQEERDRILKRISELDGRIAGIDGRRQGRPPKPAAARPTATIAAAPPATRVPRRRKARIAPKAGQTLRDMVMKALAKAGGPVKATALVDLVKKAEYRTSAKPATLVTSVYHVLADRDVFMKVGKGVFGLAAPTATPKAAKSAAPAKLTARKPAETLQSFVLRAFGKAGGPMKARHVVKRVLQMGYQTTATPQNLLISVHHALADGRLFRRVGKGLYSLALPTRGKGKVARPKGRTIAATNKAMADSREGVRMPEASAPAKGSIQATGVERY